MAEPPLDSPSPGHSATSETLAGTKRPAAATPPPPPKRHQNPTHEAINIFSSNSDETKDTASSQPEELIEQVELPDDVVFQELDEHEFNFGTNPVDDHHHMQMFCLPYIHIGVGNQCGWEVKIIRLRNKFKNQSADTIPPYQEEEFVLWKKIFERVVPGDAGSGTS